MPDPNPLPPDDPRQLRQRAERIAAEQTRQEDLPPPDRLPTLVHELRVHQIELEMQNESLRRAQAELESSRNRYADLYDFAPVGYVMLDEEGAVREINLTACEMLGRRRSRLLERRFVSYVTRNGQNRFLEYLRQCRQSAPRAEVATELTLRADPPGELSVLLRTSAAVDPETGERQYRMAIVDITARKAAEKSLTAARQDRDEGLAQLDALFSAAPIGLGFWDKDLRFVRLNYALAEINGFSPEAHLGKRIDEVVPDLEGIDEIVAVMKQVVATDQPVLDMEVSGRTAARPGEKRHWINNWFPIKVGDEVVGLGATVTDVTERKRAEQTLRETERRLTLAASSTGIGMFDWNLVTGEVFATERKALLLGLTTTTTTTTTATTTTTLSRKYHRNDWIQRVHPDDLPRVEAEVQRCMEGRVPLKAEYRVIWPDGSVHWLARRGVFYYDAQGKPQHMLGIVMDITDRKRTEEALQELNETLEQQVLERTSALAMLCDIASMANQAQDVEQALEYCLRRVAEHNGWAFGHAYLPADDDPDLLLPAYTWYAAEAERFQAFRELTLQTTLRRGEGLPGLVFDAGKPEWTTNFRAELSGRRGELAEDLGLATAAAFPVMAEDRVVGVLEFLSDKAIEPKAEMLESMAAVGLQLGRVIERKAFQDRLLTVADEQHRRIGQELHDDVGQEMTGLALQAETLAQMIAAEDTPAGKLVERIRLAAARTQRKTQALARGLVPMDIEAPGLEGALGGLAGRTDEAEGISCRFRHEGDGRVADSQAATQLYRIAQEAVANAVRHSGAERIEITLTNNAQGTVLEIHDDGRGLPPEGQTPGMGLQIMSYRAKLAGGTLSIESPPTGGTHVTCRVLKSRL